MTARDDRGASAVEYGLLIAGVAALIVVAIMALGGTVREAFTSTCEAVAGQEATAGSCTE